VLQLLRSYSTATTREEYLEVIRGKTASIISASCKAAASLAGFEGKALDAFGEYGMNLGLSFQIVDDVNITIDVLNNLGERKRPWIT